MASLFSSEEATGELNLGASSAPVIQAAAIAAAHYYRMRAERQRRSGRFPQPRKRIQVSEVFDVMGARIF